MSAPSSDELIAAEAMLDLGRCDALVADPNLAKVLTAELTALLSKTGGRRRRMHGGIRIVQAVKSLLGALCETGKMVFKEITDYPLLRMKEIEDDLRGLSADTEEGKAAKKALVDKVKAYLKSGASAGAVGIAITDLSSSSSRLVKLAVAILRALNEMYPNAFYLYDRVPALVTNLATIGKEASPVISTALITASSLWALRIMYRRVFKPAGEAAASAVVEAAGYLADDAAVDEAIDEVLLEEVPRLAEMALQAGAGAIRAAGTVWSGRLRNRARKFLGEAAGGAAAVAGAVAAIVRASAENPVAAAPAAAAAAMEAAGEDAAVDAEGAAALAAPPAVAGRRRKTRKHIRKSKKRTLRRKY